MLVNSHLIKKSILVSAYKNFGQPFHMPYKYIFILTNCCNSRCLNCRIWQIYKKNPKKSREELSFEEYEKIFEKIKDDVLWLNFSGGEPFLRKDMDSLALLSFKLFKKMFIFNIPTNGLYPRLIEKKVKNMLENCNSNVNLFVTISLDGPKEIHDKVRGVKDSYKNATDTFKRLKYAEKEFPNFKVGFQTTISKYNIESIEEIMKENNYLHRIFTFAHEARYFNNMNLGVDARKIHKKVVENIGLIYRNSKIRDLESLVSKMYLKLAMEFYKNPNKLVMPCYASFASVTVDPYGNVLPCAYFPENAGNLRENGYDIKNIICGERMKFFREKINKGECPKCWVNCEAYPSMLQNLHISIKKFLL